MSALPDARLVLPHRADRQPLLWAGRTVFDVVLGGEQTGAPSRCSTRPARAATSPRCTCTAPCEAPGRGHRDEPGARRADAERVRLTARQVEGSAGVQVVHLVTGPRRVPALEDVEDLGFLVAAAGVPVTGPTPAVWEFDVGRIRSAAPQHGIDIVGPPPRLADRPQP